MQAKIFDPFFTTKATGSHGRGLVVVKRIVQSLNGTIQVVSAAGKGATFRILLPAESDGFGQAAAPSPPPRRRPSNSGKQRS